MGVAMNVRHLLLGVLLLSLTGCGTFWRKEVDYRADAVQVPALEVPPDLTAQAASQRYAIPAADGTQVARYSDFVRESNLAAQSAVAATATPTVVVPPPQLLTVGGVRFLLVSEPFDRAWRKVGQALERAALRVSDMDRSQGVYFLSSGKDRKSAELQVRVHAADGVTDVTVSEGGSLAGKEAARVLDLLAANIEK
ncbi:MAG: hypothetical protein Fur0040_07680 [Sideroxydans sp.]